MHIQGIIMVIDEHRNISERLLKISQGQQSSELRYYSRCPLEVRILILSNKTSIFHRLRQDNGDIDKATIEYCALITAISLQHEEEQSLLNGSFISMSLEEIREVSDKQITSFSYAMTKQAKQRERVLGLWSEIRNARLKHGMSYRNIVSYLKKKHRFEVSRSLLHSMWQELEENNAKDEK